MAPAPARRQDFGASGSSSADGRRLCPSAQLFTQPHTPHAYRPFNPDTCDPHAPHTVVVMSGVVDGTTVDSPLCSDSHLLIIATGPYPLYAATRPVGGTGGPGPLPTGVGKSVLRAPDEYVTPTVDVTPRAGPRGARDPRAPGRDRARAPPARNPRPSARGGPPRGHLHRGARPTPRPVPGGPHQLLPLTAPTLASLPVPTWSGRGRRIRHERAFACCRGLLDYIGATCHRGCDAADRAFVGVRRLPGHRW